MKRKIMKRLLTVAIATTVVIGSDVTAFAQVAGGATYRRASNAVPFEGCNSVFVDVSVMAEVKEADAKTTDIALVADEDALAAATGPALLMQLKVGTDTKAITSSGTTASASIEGKPANFEVATSGGKYVYQAKSSASGWNSTTVAAHANDVDVAEATLDGSTAYVRLVANQNAVASKLTSVTVDGTAATGTVTSSGKISIANVAATTGEHTIIIVYDGTTYKAKVTK